MRRFARSVACLAVLTAAPALAQTITFDFDSVPGGTVVDTIYAAQGLTLSRTAGGSICNNAGQIFANGDRPAGFALFFPNFSTWLGKPGLYLEDVFVSEWARKLGVGRRLMARLAAIAVERGWGRLDFWVLHWNPARGFYHRLGFRHMDEWLPYRAEGDALLALAREDCSP